MKVWVKGSTSPVSLTQKDYVGQGGEGKVFARGGTAYKLYHDPSKMLPAGKIAELKAIGDPHVVCPRDILADKKGHPIGYTFSFVNNGWTLCQLFPRDFRTRNNVTPEMVQRLIDKLRVLMSSVHKGGVLIVDANEMNFLVSRGFDEVFGIDTDSYQTRSYPATAIMQSIRDWTVRNHDWTELSDWYSFAILSFQMFTGIHPFKGRYTGPELGLKKKLPADAADDSFAVTRRRMLGNVSVLHSEVRVPKAAFPVSVIPASYLGWYEQLFVQGLRLPPPDEFGAVAVLVPQVKAVTGTNLLDIIELDSFDGTVVSMWSDGVQLIVVSDKSVWKDQRPTVPPGTVSGTAFSRAGRPVLVTHDAGQVPVLTDLSTQANVPFQLAARQVMVHDGRIYCRGRTHIHEVVLTEAGSQVIASTRVAANVLEHATQLFPGVAVQDMLGSVFVSVFAGPSLAHQVRIKELDEYRIMDAKYDGGVLMVLGEKKGQYDRLVFRFDDLSRMTYDVRKVEDVQPGGLNFVVLDTGVCVCLTEEEKLELFSARKGSKAIKTVEDPVLGGDMQLSKKGGTVLFARGEEVYSMRLK